MGTDFFDRQAAARRSTGWLIVGFAVAVLAIVSAVFALTYSVLIGQGSVVSGLTEPTAQGPLQASLGAAGAALLLIVGGSFYKVAALRAGGGRGVAEGLGGERLLHDTARDESERRLLNVVDEMAIASGTPSPPVFLIDDPAINAFAAGYSPSDAVVGVTRGCVEQLSREELQGVVAHEFSHVLNGDMRMSIRLIGVLHGLLLLGLIGQFLLRIIFSGGARYSSHRPGDGDGDGKGGSGILLLLALGATLMVLGAIGTFMGGLIKAAVSRQREYLADASAVQFTRNPGGIAGALKRILAITSGSRLNHPRAAELSHMYFAQGVWEGFTSLMATHPPLDRRIRAIEPAWSGALPEPTTKAYHVELESVAAFAGNASPVAGVSIQAVDRAVDQIGDPLEEHRQYASALLGSIPPLLRSAAGEPSQARAVVYGLLLSGDPEVRRRQQETLKEVADPAVVLFLFTRVAPLLEELDPRLRLPLIDLSLPSLAAMSFPQYQRFCRSFRALVVADERLDLFEWTLSQVLLRHLRPQFERVRSPRVYYRNLDKLSGDCAVLLSALAYACGESGDVSAGYTRGRELLKEAPPQVISRAECGLDPLRSALERIARAEAHHRGRVVDAAAAVICSDGLVEVAEAELLRGIADLLDCPMPPLLPGQTVEAS